MTALVMAHKYGHNLFEPTSSGEVKWRVSKTVKTIAERNKLWPNSSTRSTPPYKWTRTSLKTQRSTHVVQQNATNCCMEWNSGMKIGRTHFSSCVFVSGLRTFQKSPYVHTCTRNQRDYHPKDIPLDGCNVFLRKKSFHRTKHSKTIATKMEKTMNQLVQTIWIGQNLILQNIL